VLPGLGWDERPEQIKLAKNLWSLEGYGCSGGERGLIEAIDRRAVEQDLEKDDRPLNVAVDGNTSTGMVGSPGNSYNVIGIWEAIDIENRSVVRHYV